MNTNSKLKTAAVAVACIGLLCAGCGSEQVAAKYTEQTARAIIESGWKISGALILAAVIRGCLNK